MKTYQRKLLLAAALCVAISAVSAHAILTQAVPLAGAMLTRSPPEIRLQFNEPLEAAFSQLVLIDQSGATVSTAKPAIHAGPPAAMVLPLPILSAGRYLVNWSTMTRDGHRTKGRLTFTLR